MKYLINVFIYAIIVLLQSSCSRSFHEEIYNAEEISADYVIFDSGRRVPQYCYLGSDKYFSYFLVVLAVPTTNTIFASSTLEFFTRKVPIDKLKIIDEYIIDINSAQSKERMNTVILNEERNIRSYREFDTHPVKKIIEITTNKSSNISP